METTLGPPPGGPVVLTVCRLVARKGPGTLIAALPRVLARHPGTTLAIVGEGPDRRRLGRSARAHGVAAAVRFLGPQPWGNLPGFYAGADVFALPTRERFRGLETEGFPLVFLEAASAGLPTVAGRAGGVGEAVAEGETGFIVDGRSAGDRSQERVYGGDRKISRYAHYQEPVREFRARQGPRGDGGDRQGRARQNTGCLCAQ